MKNKYFNYFLSEVLHFHLSILQEKNLICFVCPSEFENVEQLCKHVQNVHKIRGYNNYKCKLCERTFGELNVFKRHLNNCWRKTKKPKNINIKQIDQVRVSEFVRIP